MGRGKGGGEVYITMTLTPSMVSDEKTGWYTNDGPSNSTNFPFKPLSPDGGDDRSKPCFINECASHIKASPIM